MKKVNFKNSRGLNLVGILYPSSSNRAVIISHGFTANKDRERLVKLAESLNKEDFAVLRFDFSGCGESDDDFIKVNSEVKDLKSAIEFVKNKGYDELGLVGESLAGLVDLMVWNKEIKSMVLWAPVTYKKNPELEGLNKLGENEEFIIHKKDGREFKIHKDYFEERATIDKEKLLSRIEIPVLIIHGDLDNTVPLEESKKAIKFLPENSKLEISKGAGHKLEENMQEVISITTKWLKENLK